MIDDAGSRAARDLLHFAHFAPPGETQDLGECVPVDGRVDLWAFSLVPHPNSVERWLSDLSADEAAVAQRFRRPADRDAYVVAHGVTRRLLGGYCGVAPRTLRFERAQYGKPALRAAPGQPPLRFNLAHSGHGALLAIASREIGVDIELARSGIDVESIAARFFCASERAAIAGAPASVRVDAFFRHWVAKEAMLKAEGVGLSRPLDSFAVALSQDGSAVRLTSPEGKDALADWRVQLLRMPPGWHGALCAPADAKIRVRAPARVTG
jgi:4'-phosphopantetheinyl transferase